MGLSTRSAQRSTDSETRRFRQRGAAAARHRPERNRVREDRVRIAVLSPFLAGAYYGQVLKGVARHAATLGGRVVAVQARDGRPEGTYPWLPERAGGRLAWDQVDALITVLDAADETYLEEVRA